MASGDKDGGPAFPGHSAVKTGMTLRDWFAGQALAGLLAHDGQNSADPTSVAYEYADCMIYERKAPRE